jgi:hypothetical protein
MEPVSVNDETPDTDDTTAAPAHPDVARLRAGGWTVAAIADAIGASEREIYRWSRGVAPIGIYRRLLAALPDAPTHP